MKKSTKILFILFVVTLIPSLFLGKFIIAGIVPVDNKITFNIDTKAIIGLCLTGVNMIVGTLLFFKFLSSLPLDKVLFFTSIPLVLIYGLLLFFLGYINSLNNDLANAIKSLLNITQNNTYNLILWVIILTLVFVFMLFLNYTLICRPVSKMERVVSRLGDGMVRNGRFNIGGGKQFNKIEHSLNKINNYYKESEGDFSSFYPSGHKKFPKQFYRILGRDGIREIDNGHEVNRKVVLMGIKLTNSTSSDALSGENFDTINSYFNLMSPTIKKYGGYIDKYMRNKIVAVFAKSVDAIECEHALCRIIDAKNKQQHMYSFVNLRISLVFENVRFSMAELNSKNLPTIISNIDILDKFDELARFMSIRVIFPKSCIDELPLNYRFKYRYVGCVSVSGKEVLLFEDLTVYTKQTREKLFKTKNLFENGILEYENENYKKAGMIFENCLKEFANDNACYVYYNKAKEKAQ